MENKEPASSTTKQRGVILSSLDAVVINRKLILRAAITISYYALLFYLIRLLFFYKPSPDYKDVLLIIVGALVGNLTKVTDFWFHRESEDIEDSKKYPTN